LLRPPLLSALAIRSHSSFPQGPARVPSAVAPRGARQSLKNVVADTPTNAKTFERVGRHLRAFEQVAVAYTELCWLPNRPGVLVAFRGCTVRLDTGLRQLRPSSERRPDFSNLLACPKTPGLPHPALCGKTLLLTNERK
jgi:hypothetical protein